MKPIAFYLLYSLLIPITNAQSVYIKGIWIPEKINSRHLDFNTVCIMDDSLAVVIFSTQQQCKDSIQFHSAPAIAIKKGWYRSVKPNTFLLSTHTIYQENIPEIKDAETFIFTLSDEINPIGQQLTVNGTKYSRAHRYTQQSKEYLYRLLTQTIPDLERRQLALMPRPVHFLPFGWRK